MDRVSLSDAYTKAGIDAEDNVSIPKIDPNQKRYMADNHIPFEIVRVDLFSNPQFSNAENVEGLFWSYTIRIGNPPGIARLDMGYNEDYKKSHEAIQGMCEAGNIVGPVELQVIDTSKGNSFYRIVEEQKAMQRRLAEAIGVYGQNDNESTEQAALPF